MACKTLPDLPFLQIYHAKVLFFFGPTCLTSSFVTWRAESDPQSSCQDVLGSVTDGGTASAPLALPLLLHFVPSLSGRVWSLSALRRFKIYSKIGLFSLKRGLTFSAAWVICDYTQERSPKQPVCVTGGRHCVPSSVQTSSLASLVRHSPPKSPAGLSPLASQGRCCRAPCTAPR